MRVSGELPGRRLGPARRMYRFGVRVTGSARRALGALTSRPDVSPDGNSPYDKAGRPTGRPDRTVREEEVRGRARVAARARIAASPGTPATPGGTVGGACTADGTRHGSLRAPNAGA